MSPISDPLKNKTIEKDLRTAAETIEQLDKQKIKNLLLQAADMLEMRDAQLWAINDELVKAGLKPWQYDSFAACVAVLREPLFPTITTRAFMYHEGDEIILPKGGIFDELGHAGKVGKITSLGDIGEPDSVRLVVDDTDYDCLLEDIEGAKIIFPNDNASRSD